MKAVQDTTAPIAMPSIAVPTPTVTLTEADRAAATNLLTSGPWKMSGGGWSDVRVFKKNGTFSTPGHPEHSGRWKFSKNLIVLNFADGHDNTVTLPLDPKGTPGADESSRPTTSVLIDAH